MTANDIQNKLLGILGIPSAAHVHIPDGVCEALIHLMMEEGFGIGACASRLHQADKDSAVAGMLQRSLLAAHCEFACNWLQASRYARTLQELQIKSGRVTSSEVDALLFEVEAAYGSH